MAENSKLATNLRIQRAKKGLTQQEVADYLGVKQQTYSKYEKGSPLDNDILVKLCELYKVSADELLGINAKPKITEQSYELNDQKINELIKRVLVEVEGDKRNG